MQLIRPRAKKPNAGTFRRRRAAGRERGRVLAVFGPPEVDVASILQDLTESARVRTKSVAVLEPAASFQAFEAEIEGVRRRGAEVIFLDGFPGRADDVQWLYDTRFVAPAYGGALVYLHPSTTRDALPHDAHRLARLEIEVRALQLSTPCLHIPADDPAFACERLIAEAGL
jgi:hypothetical protein